MLQLHFQALAFSSPSLLAVGSFFFFLYIWLAPWGVLSFSLKLAGFGAMWRQLAL